MIDNSIEFLGINIAILTVSDTRNFDNDKSGSTLIKLIEDYGHTCLLRDIVQDEPKEILFILNKWIKNKNLDVIITSGGTGLTGRDITVDVLETYFDKKIDGLVNCLDLYLIKKLVLLLYKAELQQEQRMENIYFVCLALLQLVMMLGKKY